MTTLTFDLLDAEAVAQLEGLSGGGGPLRLDLELADPPTSPVLARLVDVLTALAKTRAVTLVAPPQMLAHTLYKAGRLRSGRLTIEAERTEEPYAG